MSVSSSVAFLAQALELANPLRGAAPSACLLATLVPHASCYSEILTDFEIKNGFEQVVLFLHARLV